jgi:hypothetical protein
MVINTATTLAMAAVCLAAIATVPASHAATQRHTVTVKHAPIVSPGDVSESWSPQQNIIESKQYEQLLRTNPAFRQARMRKECGSITDPQLHQSCIASFDRYGPSVGSSTPPRHYHSSAGR